MALPMKQILAKAGLIFLSVAVPATATAQVALEGQWRNAKGSVVVRVSPCGNALCGVVVNASERAKEGARRGGTPNLIGTRILTGLRPAGDGTFKGQAFDPKRNVHAAATVRLIGPDALEVRGCAYIFICKEQRWTRVS
jgi:uncharacterized protein (DUF2147 family)